MLLHLRCKTQGSLCLPSGLCWRRGFRAFLPSACVISQQFLTAVIVFTLLQFVCFHLLTSVLMAEAQSLVNFAFCLLPLYFLFHNMKRSFALRSHHPNDCWKPNHWSKAFFLWLFQQRLHPPAWWHFHQCCTPSLQSTEDPSSPGGFVNSRKCAEGFIPDWGSDK